MATSDLAVPQTLPAVIAVRGARHNNLHDVDVDVPLWRVVAVVGVSGSGKTSLAIGTLYAEGMHRFLEGLSTYSRRRLTQAQRPDVDRIDHLPPALALRQRPPIPGPRSTVGTMSEVLNVLRLMMSRLGSHLCPNGHRVEPSIATQQMVITCPVDGVRFEAPSAESFAFNSYGACPACQGLGVRSEVDVDALVPDPDLSISDGAVLPWNAGARRLYQYAARELGVRLDVPWKDLTDRERDIVLHGEPVQRRVRFRSGRRNREVELNVTYENAIATAQRNLDSDSEQARRQVNRFFVTRTCSVCHGTRLRPEALTSLLGGKNLAEISALRLDELREFAAGLPPQLPAELDRLTKGLLGELNGVLNPLLDVGLGYLTLDRSGASLSTGERQRIELTSTVRASTTGMLYVLDEPSVGLHPSNVQGLRRTIAALAANGNSVVVVEHEGEIIRTADWVIELGPAAGAAGGAIVAQGPPPAIEADPHSIIGPYLSGAKKVERHRPAGFEETAGGELTVEVGDLYNLHNVTATFPVRRLTALAGPSGAGKTALVLDSLIPAAEAQLAGADLPGHVKRLDLAGLRQVVQIDASPIGQNARSTPATYSGAFDQIRRLFAETPYAKRRRWKPGHFSFNTKEGQCPTCRGLGGIDLDVQYLPDINVVCPTCHGARFNDATLAVKFDGLTIADVLDLTVHEALARFAGQRLVANALRPVDEVGLGYLRLGEPTPSLSGGESQRLRIASRLRSSQRGALYVFDEPSTGLHPLDVATLVAVFDRLLTAGATIIVIDHDLDLLGTADYLIDMGPGGGPDGGHIVAAGTPAAVAQDPASVTGPWLAEHLGLQAPARRWNLRGRDGFRRHPGSRQAGACSPWPEENPMPVQTAVVTGASRGFGRAIAATLIGAGHTVIGVARSQPDLQAARDELGERFIPVAGDATSEELAREVLSEHRPGLLVLNAGADPHLAALPAQTWETFSRNWHTDTRQAFTWTREALRLPLPPGSVIVLMSSGAALAGSPLSGGYAGAKATVRFIRDYAAGEADRAGLGLRFVTLLPRLTPATGLGAAAVAGYAARQGVATDAYVKDLQPVLTTGQVAAAVLTVAGDPASAPEYLVSGAGLRPVDRP